MKSIFLIIMFLFVTSYSRASENVNAIGARVGFIPGVTFRHFHAEDTALEAILSTEGQGHFLSLIQSFLVCISWFPLSPKMDTMSTKFLMYPVKRTG